jgi:hypothetical protein
MLVNLIIPTIAVFLFVGFLVWDSRLPTERSVLHQLRIAKKQARIKHKLH